MKKIQHSFLCQAGEFLTGLQLTKRKFKVRIFGGTFPGCDLLTWKEEQHRFFIEVRAKKRVSQWQFSDVRKELFDVAANKRTKRQKIGRNLAVDENKIYVFLTIGDLENLDNVRYFLIRHKDLQRFMRKKYYSNLKKQNFIRPRKYDSFHSSLNEKELRKFEDNWPVLEK
jgi:hypothetical protein